MEILTTTMPNLDNIESIQHVALEVTQALKVAASKVIPSGKFKPKLKPYWKDGLDRLHENSKSHRCFWITDFCFKGNR